jgi:hypothetical protein
MTQAFLSSGGGDTRDEAGLLSRRRDDEDAEEVWMGGRRSRKSGHGAELRAGGSYAGNFLDAEISGDEGEAEDEAR